MPPRMVEPPDVPPAAGPVCRTGPAPANLLDEPARLARLRGYGVLDTPAEQAYDALVELAAFICGTPISAVSFVEADRQWFKASVGLDVAETDRSVSFCAHAMVSGAEVFVVPDATLDPRFCDSELVTGPMRMRFYAGAPLITHDGFPLGSLCVIDTVPRTLSASQLSALRALAVQVHRPAGGPAHPRTSG